MSSEAAGVLRMAKTVEPEPLMSAAATSGRELSQSLSSARKRCLKKTGRSRSLMSSPQGKEMGE